MEDYYAITGFFRQLARGDNPFGGFLEVNQEDKTLTGMLVDKYGASTVQGTLKDDTLAFEKRYANRPPISYRLQKDKHDVYSGSFDGIQTGAGTVMCRLTLHYKNVENEAMTMDDHAREMIESAVQFGLIEKVHHNGEECIRVAQPKQE